MNFIPYIIAIHKGTAIAKAKATFMLSLFASPVVFLLDNITNWAVTNSAYIYFTGAAIIIDHILGTAVHLFVKKDFSAKKNIVGFLVKSALVVAVGILIEGFRAIGATDTVVFDYFNMFGRLMVFVYPAGSALMNSSIITKGVFPPTSFMERLTRFNKEMSLDPFKQEKPQ
ncbi:hypothetical protein [Cellulophaga lytica]|uniref:hypothetical protein n=1 Tax=Cellulophaga lytica TaxID=979 RepID=UPI003CE487DB